jgi:hypothetical protein
MTDIPIRFVGTDTSAAAANSAKRNVESVGRAAAGASGPMDAMNNAAKTLAGGLGGLGAAMVGGAIVGFASQIGSAVVAMGRAGAATQELRASFENVAAAAGMSGEKILSTLRTASEGMVSNQELVSAGNRAIMMGAAKNAEQLAQLMEIAKVRSDAVGISVGEAFASITEGIGRVSERQLYAVGINVDLAAANDTYAASLGTTASKLSETEKRQAMYNAVVADSAGLVEAAGGAGMSNADKMDQFAASWANLKQTMGELVAGPMADFMALMNEGLQGGMAAASAASEALTTTSGEQIQALNSQIRASKSEWMEYASFSESYADRILNNLNEQIAAANAAGTIAPTLLDFGFSPDDLDGAYQALTAYQQMREAQAQINALVRTEADERREIAGLISSGAMAAASAAAETARRAASAAALKDQYASVAAVQANYRNLVQMQMEVAAAAEAAGLSIAQTEAITAQAAAQYAILTDNGYTSAQALDMVTAAISGQIATLPALGSMLSDLALILATEIPAAAATAAEAVANMFTSVMAGIGAMGRDIMADSNINPGAPAKSSRTTGPGKAGPAGARTNTQEGFAGMDAIERAAGFTASRLQTLGSAGGGAASKLGDVAAKAGDLSGKLQGLIDKVPGLKGTSPTTEQQMEDAKLGIPQNFADDYLRRLTDEVMNGVDWAGVDMADAAKRAGIDPSLPVQAQLKLFSQAWQDSSLFADPKNLDLINMDAVKAAMTQQAAAGTGAANINALFGIGDDATVQAVASLGLSVQSGLSEWLTSNGMADAGAKLAAAINGGVTTAGIPLDGGLNTWIGSDSASAAAASIGGTLSQMLSAQTVITPTVNLPVLPGGTGAPPPGGPPSGGTTLPASLTVPKPGGVTAMYAAGMLNAARTGKGAQVVNVNTVVNERMDEAKFSRMLRDALRKGTVKT